MPSLLGRKKQSQALWLKVHLGYYGLAECERRVNVNRLRKDLGIHTPTSIMRLGADSKERFNKMASVDFDFADWAVNLPTNFDQLLQAIDIADEIFWEQMSAQYDRDEILKEAGDDEELRELILFNYGPYDRLNDDSPFLRVPPKDPALDFYPRNFTREDFTAYVQEHPESRAAFESPYTVIRQKNSGFEAIPYHEVYRDKVNTLSSVLKQASESEPDASFRQYLSQKASDLLTDDYYKSDRLWVGLESNPIDLVVGPYEVYEDQLMGLKAAYEAILLARDFGESIKIREIETEVRGLCGSLEPVLGKALHFEDSRVKLSVARLLYAGGEGRVATPAIAFNLPNDEQVLEEVGSRQIILINVLQAKFDLVAWPMLLKLFPNTLANHDTAFREFFNHTIFHEISHSIGPQRILKNGSLTTVNRCLKQHYSVLEEAKADTLATCFKLTIMEPANMHTFMENYVAGLIRAIRFGLGSAHGGSNAIQLNFMLRENAIRVENDRIVIHENARKAVFKLTANILDIQERGDFGGAKTFVESFCTVTNDVRTVIDSVISIPTDIRIRYNSLSPVRAA